SRRAAHAWSPRGRSLLLLCAAAVALVGEHDTLHQRVAYDVARGEEREHDPLDVAQHFDHVLETRTLLARQVDLCDVAGYDAPRAKGYPGQEHLHCVDGRFLRLVEDDERVVERSAAHERERGDLDDLPLDRARDAVEAEHL